jgi:hypothetical protein
MEYFFMAKIVEEALLIKLSKLVRTGDKESKEKMANAEVVAALEQVAQELVGENVIVEVESGK